MRDLVLECALWALVVVGVTAALAAVVLHSFTLLWITGVAAGVASYLSDDLEPGARE